MAYHQGAGENVAFVKIVAYLRGVAADIATVWMAPIAWNGIRQRYFGTAVWKGKAYQHGCLRCSPRC